MMLNLIAIKLIIAKLLFLPYLSLISATGSPIIITAKEITIRPSFTKQLSATFWTFKLLSLKFLRVSIFQFLCKNRLLVFNS